MASATPQSRKPRGRSLADRLLRYVALPVAVGVAAGFAFLWMQASQRADEADPRGSDNSHEADSFADAVGRAAPAVVSVFSLTTRNPLCDLPQFRAMCERFYRGRQSQNSLGSGVIMRADGYILTNRHVIAAGDDIVVAFGDGSQTHADLVGADRGTDLAVLKVSETGLPAIDQASADQARVGDFVLAIGNPFGIGVQAVSLGIVSAKGSYRVDQSPYSDDFIQTDAAINPGNSGGALIDRHGRLLGINTLFYSGSGRGSDGVGLAIPVERAVAVMDEIIEHGQVLRGWLGIVLVDPPQGETGLVIVRVYRRTPGGYAGLRPGDVVLTINGEAVGTAREATLLVRNTEPGAELTIQFRRDGAVRQVKMTAAALPSAS